MITVCTINEETFEVEADLFDIEYDMLVFKSWDDIDNPIAAFPKENVMSIIWEYEK